MRSGVGFTLMIVGVALGFWAAVGILFWIGAATHLLGAPAVGPNRGIGEVLVVAVLAYLARLLFRSGKSLGGIR